MKTQRILVCDAEPPNECVDSFMAAIEDGKNHLCSKNGVYIEMCFMRGVGDARAAITTFEPHVILLLLRRDALEKTRAIVEIADELAAPPPVVALIAEGGQDTSWRCCEPARRISSSLRCGLAKSCRASGVRSTGTHVAFRNIRVPDSPVLRESSGKAPHSGGRSSDCRGSPGAMLAS
jgi:hypothetical protein